MLPHIYWLVLCLRALCSSCSTSVRQCLCLALSVLGCVYRTPLGGYPPLGLASGSTPQWTSSLCSLRFPLVTQFRGLYSMFWWLQWLHSASILTLPCIRCYLSFAEILCGLFIALFINLQQLIYLLNDADYLRFFHQNPEEQHHYPHHNESLKSHIFVKRLGLCPLRLIK
jgi:hypothetical protein